MWQASPLTASYSAQDGLISTLLKMRVNIIGCGAIGPFWGKEDESSLFTIFVKPEEHGKGIGRKIIETLEQDEYFLRAKRIEIPSSINAVNFYKHFGYDHKKGFEEPDEEMIYRLEKFR